MQRISIKNRKQYWTAYTALFVVMTLIILAPYFIRGNSFIRDGDGFNQTYPVLVYIGSYIKDFVKSGLPLKQFDFTLGLGENIFTALSWLGLGDCFTLLAVLVDPEHMDYIFSLIVLVKLFCGGVTFSCYALYHKAEEKYVLLGAMMYAFSRFALVSGFEFYQNLNGFVWTPLLALGIDKIFDRLDIRKNFQFVTSKTFIFGVWILAINGFYYLYMATIFCVIYFIVKYCTTQEKKGLFSFFRKVFIVSINYINGLLLAAVIFLPLLLGYFNSSRTERESQAIHELLLYPMSGYIRIFENMFIPKGWELSLGLPFITLMGLIVFSCSKKKTTEWWLTIVLLFASLVPLTGVIMNGFSYDTDRWQYMIYFVASFLVVRFLEEIPGKAIHFRQWLTFLVISGASLLLYLLNGGFEERGGMLRWIYYVVCLIVFGIYFWKVFKRKKYLFRYKYVSTAAFGWFLVFVNIVLNGLIINGPVILGGSGYSAGFREYDSVYPQIKGSIADGLKKEEEFYRADVYDSSYGTSLVLDYPGTAQYFSITNHNIFDFYKEMEISPGIRSASHILRGIDGRLALESILSVKYYQDMKLWEGDYVPVLSENLYYLPFGFTYGNFILKEEFDGLNPLEKMETVLHKVVLEERPEEDWEEGSELYYSYRKVGNRLEYERMNVQEGRLDVSSGSRLHIYLDQEFSEESQGELYICLEKFKLLSEGIRDIQVGNKDIQIRNENGLYYIGEDDFWVNVSVPDGNHIVIEFSEEGSFSLGSLQTYWFPTGMLSTQTNMLREYSLENLNIGTNKVSGNIELNTDRLLFFSIPYSSGWTAYVDGTKQEIYKANIGFMAIPLKEGVHKVELRYRTPGLYAGILLLSVGIVFDMLLVIMAYRQKMKRKRREFVE